MSGANHLSSTFLLQNGALWDIWLMHGGICEVGLLISIRIDKYNGKPIRFGGDENDENHAFATQKDHDDVNTYNDYADTRNDHTDCICYDFIKNKQLKNITSIGNRFYDDCRILTMIEVDNFYIDASQEHPYWWLGCINHELLLLLTFVVMVIY